MELEDQLAIPVLPLRLYTNLLKSRRSLDSPAHAGDVARVVSTLFDDVELWWRTINC